MENNVDAVIISQNRGSISKVGSTLGTAYFKAEARASWPAFKEEAIKVKNNGNIDLILNRTPCRYRLTSHDITSVILNKDATGATKVYINKDLEGEVSIPVGAGMDKIGVVTEDAVGKALHGNTNIIFANASKLANQLNTYNEDEKTRLLALRDKIDKFINQIDSAIEENKRKVEIYERELVTSTPDGIAPTAKNGNGVVMVNDPDEE